MNKILSDVLADILIYSGAEVEKTEEGSLDVVVPQEVSKILGIPEYARLVFSYGEEADHTVYASYDSELFRSIKSLLAGMARFSLAIFKTATPNIERLLKVVSEKVSLNNATFRLERTRIEDTSYLLIYFKYEALSDEKHEGILPLLINEMTLSTIPLEYNIEGLIEEKLKEKVIERYNLKDVLYAAYISASQVIKERLNDFKRSLERRLNRDIKRVYEYYEALKAEIKATIEKKVALQDKLLDKLKAIEIEERFKIQDLVSKYALNIHIEPISAIRIETTTPVFWINIKRRSGVRQFPLIYNPIKRQFDSLPCQSCYNPQSSYYICDDKLHIVCGRCFEECCDCKRQYCRACHKDMCPKCKKISNNK